MKEQETTILVKRLWGQAPGKHNITGAEEEHVVLLEFLSWNQWGLEVFFSSLIEV